MCVLGCASTEQFEEDLGRRGGVLSSVLLCTYLVAKSPRMRNLQKSTLNTLSLSKRENVSVRVCMRACARADPPFKGFQLGACGGGCFPVHTLHGEPCTGRRRKSPYFSTQFIRSCHIETCRLVCAQQTLQLYTVTCETTGTFIRFSRLEKAAK